MSLLLGAQSVPATTWTWAGSVSSDRHLDALPLARLGDDDVWSRVQPRPGRNLGYLRDEARLSALRGDGQGEWQGDWQLSLLARQSATALVSEGALQLARVTQADGAPATDQHYAVSLHYLGFSGAGLELGRTQALGRGWQATLALQGLSLARVVERVAEGQADYLRATDNGTDHYSATLQSLQADDRLRFPYQQPQARRGSAWLLHGALAWQGKQADASVQWRDAGWLRWQGLPQQALRLASDIQSVDAQGYVVYAPLVQGQNSQPGYRRWLAPTSTWTVGWRTPSQDRFSVAVQWLPGWGVLPRAGWQRSVGPASLALAWRFHERRAEAGLTLPWGHGQWQLNYGIDRTGAAWSRSVGVAWRSATPGRGISPP